MQEPSTQQFPFSSSASVTVSQSGHCHFSWTRKGELNFPAPVQIFVCCHMQTDWGLFSLTPQIGGLFSLAPGSSALSALRRSHLEVLVFFLFLMLIPSFSLTFWRQTHEASHFYFPSTPFLKSCWNSAAEIVSPLFMNFCFLEILPNVWHCRGNLIFFCVISLPAPDLLFISCSTPIIPLYPCATTHTLLCTSKVLWKTQAWPKPMF